MKQPLLILILMLAGLCFNTPVPAQPMSSEAIDQLVEKTMKTFNVPGIAVGIVKDGNVILAKGYGVRSLQTGEPVNEHTLFGIASNTKAFTSVALGILVDEGRLKWDDRVIDYIPEFQVYDPYVTQDFRICDLLTHRSGLGLGAGDLMIWPDGCDFTRSEIIHNFRYLKQASPFRSKYDYDNILYIIAGEVIQRLSGLSWEEFIETRIFKPLGMKESSACFNRLVDTTNVIAAHCPVNGKLQVIRRTRNEQWNPAGGIYSNIVDLSRWVGFHLSKGAYGSEGTQRLISRQTHQDLWTPQTLIGTTPQLPYNTHFAAYGLGFILTDPKGYLQVSHNGGLAGMVTRITMFPEINLGIIVLTNQQEDAAFTAIANQIQDGYIGVNGMDWLKILEDRVNRRKAEAASVTGKIWDEIAKQKSAGGNIIPDFELFAGSYRDPWFGEVTIGNIDDKLFLKSKRSAALTGEMVFYKGSCFIVKWNDRSLDADAFVLFQSGYDGKISGFTMKAISPLTDFSFDFHDLEFKRINELK